MQVLDETYGLDAVAEIVERGIVDSVNREPSDAVRAARHRLPDGSC